jgi:hypothetical protein
LKLYLHRVNEPKTEESHTVFEAKLPIQVLKFADIYDIGSMDTVDETIIVESEDSAAKEETNKLRKRK